MEIEIPKTSGLVSKTSFSPKAKKLENKIGKLKRLNPMQTLQKLKIKYQMLLY